MLCQIAPIAVKGQAVTIMHTVKDAQMTEVELVCRVYQEANLCRRNLCGALPPDFKKNALINTDKIARCVQSELNCWRKPREPFQTSSGMDDWRTQPANTTIVWY